MGKQNSEEEDEEEEDEGGGGRKRRRRQTFNFFRKINIDNLVSCSKAVL